jgi:hypothetical protein
MLNKIARICATLMLVPMLATASRAQSHPHIFPVTGASGNVAAAPAVATLPGAPGLTTFISGFEITASGATAATCVNATLAGVVSGALIYTYCVPTGVASLASPLVVSFTPPLPAASVNTPISVTLPSLGSGNTNATVVAHGFQQ